VDCGWLVDLLRTKLAKENEPEENPTYFPNKQRHGQLIIHIIVLILFF